jgi:hypothetical protein
MKKFIALIAILTAFTMLFCGCITEPSEQNKTADSSITAEENEYNYTFTFEVVDLEGKTETKSIETSEKILGDVLQNLGLIKGEEGPYGLYIKEVNGIVADYDKDRTYWALYVNGEYAMTGADQIKITDGAIYSFRVETM